MKCTECDFESDDVVELTLHLMKCEGKPVEKWKAYVTYGTEPMPFKNSDILEEEDT